MNVNNCHICEKSFSKIDGCWVIVKFAYQFFCDLCYKDLQRQGRIYEHNGEWYLK